MSNVPTPPKPHDPSPLNILDGWKTYIAAIGLACLGVYQLSTGDIPAAVQSFLAALSAAGIRRAITTATVSMQEFYR